MTAQPPEQPAYLVEVGMRIRAGRMRRRISQHRLSACAELSRVTLSSLERGEHAARLLTYVKVAHALGIAVGDLLTERPTPWP